MDNDLVVWIVVLLLLAVGGWVLGVVGFFSSRRALREIAELRRRSVTAPLVVPEAIPEPPPTSVPSFIPEPVSSRNRRTLVTSPKHSSRQADRISKRC